MLIIAARRVLDLEVVDLGSFDQYTLLSVPVLVLVLFTLLDAVATRYLREALAHSETARCALAALYATLERQKQTIEASKKNLAELAEQLQHSNDDLHRLNEELKSFAYSVSHDMRAPLINLKGFSAELRAASGVLQPVVEAGLRDVPGDRQSAVRSALEEDIPEALGFIEASVQRMDGLINAVLQLSRLGRRDLTFESIDMNRLVEDTLKTLAHQIEEKQVRVTVGALPEVVADRVSMEQIMGNLLTNAVMYLEPGRQGEVYIAGSRDRQETMFQVRDNGRGIAEEDRAKVFQLFRRAGRQEVPGEGMGLAYVQTLVRRHGGRIWFDSKPGMFLSVVTLPNGE